MFQPKGGYIKSDVRRKQIRGFSRPLDYSLTTNATSTESDRNEAAAVSHEVLKSSLKKPLALSTTQVDDPTSSVLSNACQQQQQIILPRSYNLVPPEEEGITRETTNMANMQQCREVGDNLVTKSSHKWTLNKKSYGRGGGSTFLGWRTVEDGNQVLLWSKNGEGKVIKGPARVRLWRSSIEELENFRAGQGEYLVVQRKDGEKKIHPGPCSMFLNPIEHCLIEQRRAIFINSGECMVIYREKKAGNGNGTSVKKDVDLVSIASNSIERAIKYGPCQFIPQPEEWIHEFVWHGTDHVNKGLKTYGSLKFNKLRTIADQMYYNVQEVRTKDDTLLTVKLMIFFQLTDINIMLDNTHDPIGDFINAACSDVVAFCAALTYEEFLEKTSTLNQLDTFKQLCNRASTIGYKINKVVFRGFQSSLALQNMHDKSIQERTKLRLATDTEHQRQSHIDFQLEKEEERSGRERALEVQADEHQRLLKAANHVLEMKQKKEWHQHEMECMKEAQEVENSKLAKLKDLGVNLTELLIAKEKVPDRTFRIEGQDGKALAGKEVKLHLHEEFSAASKKKTDV